MIQRRWPFVVVAAIVALALLVGAWAIGRATAPDDTTTSDAPAQRGNAIELIGGVPVGVQQSRAGALAAADNYVALATETVIQDPKRYEQLVRRVYAPSYQPTALREGASLRRSATKAVETYAAGGRTIAVVAARRLDTYGGTRAAVTTWLGGVTWGPDRKPGQNWQLIESSLRWDGQRWLVERMDDASRPAPAPTVVGYDNADSLKSSTFDRELRGMTAPTYGDG